MSDDAPQRPRARAEATRVEVAVDRGVFMISVAAELASMHPQTLRMYEARGLLEPKRSPKGTRLYSNDDVQRLRRIQQMTAELGLNLAGVERVLELEDHIDRMQRQIETLEREAELARERLVAELEQVRRSFRAELVPLRRSSTAIVPAAAARSQSGLRMRPPQR